MVLGVKYEHLGWIVDPLVLGEVKPGVDPKLGPVCWCKGDKNQTLLVFHLSP